MQNYDQIDRNTELLFGEFEAKAKKFLEKCSSKDATHRFVTKLSEVLANKLQSSHEIKAVVEVLRGSFWLNFIQVVRQSDDDFAEALLAEKDALLNKYESITSGVVQSCGEELKIRNNTTIGNAESNQRKSY